MKIMAYVIGFAESERILQFKQRHQRDDFFELIPAVDGRVLPISLLEKIFSAPFFAHQLKNKGEKWLGASLGCFLSHINAIETAKKQHADFVIIAEDDAEFRADPRLMIPALVMHGVELLYLNDRMRCKTAVQPQSGDIIFLTEDNLTGTGTEAYILSQQGMNKVLALFARGVKRSMPTGYDGFLQSFCIRSNKKIITPGKKSLNEWVVLRKSLPWEQPITVSVAVANPSLAAHNDRGISIINAK
jgi:GR25 family glycosyltransferase involved in LPS biosynthesis